MLLRSCVSCDTLRPRYSVRTAAVDVRNLSEISATVAALSGLAMALLPGSSSRSVRGHDERPGAGARGVRNRSARGAARGTPATSGRTSKGPTSAAVRSHLRGPPAAAGPSTTLAGGDRRSLATDSVRTSATELQIAAGRCEAPTG